MQKLNLGFSKYSDSNLLVQAQAKMVALTGNTYFPSPQPTLAEFQTKINTYSDALSAAKDRSKNNIAAKKAARVDLTNTLTRLGMNLMQTANGDIQALISTAYDLSKSRQPRPPLEKPQVIKMEDGINSGEFWVYVAPLLGARTFVYQYTEDAITENSVWQSQNATTTKVLLTGLEPGKKYWVKVLAYGVNEQEVLSDSILSPICR